MKTGSFVEFFTRFNLTVQTSSNQKEQKETGEKKCILSLKTKKIDISIVNFANLASDSNSAS